MKTTVCFTVIAMLLVISLPLAAQPLQGEGLSASEAFETIEVAGTGVHYMSNMIVHSTEPTGTGMIQLSTDIVELEGDLAGRVLYHPVSEFDFVAGTLVNTGHQVFSGTVAGHGPVLLHDDQFRFEVDLTTGATTGEAFFNDRLAGPSIRCELDIIGTGLTPAGDATVTYTGTCRVKTAGLQSVDRRPAQP